MSHRESTRICTAGSIDLLGGYPTTDPARMLRLAGEDGQVGRSEDVKFFQSRRIHRSNVHVDQYNRSGVT